MELPSSFYYIVGFLIVTNLGSIGTIATVAFKAVWWASKLESKVDASHKRLDVLEGKKYNQP